MEHVDFKEKRRKDLFRKKLDKQKRNPMARQLHSSRYRLRILEDKVEKGGAKNLLKEIDNVQDD